MRKHLGGPGEMLLMLDPQGRLWLNSFVFPGSDNQMCVYCVKGKSGKSCIKIVSAQHPFASNILNRTIAYLDSRGRITIPKEYIKQAKLVLGGEVLVTQSETRSHLEVWLPANYDLEWKAVLEAAGIETTL